jgi:large subunit ribosomal protein L6
VLDQAPDGIEFEVPHHARHVKGIDKQRVGETAANIRKQRTPSPTRARHPLRGRVRAAEGW